MNEVGVSLIEYIQSYGWHIVFLTIFSLVIAPKIADYFVRKPGPSPDVEQARRALWEKKAKALKIRMARVDRVQLPKKPVMRNRKSKRERTFVAAPIPPANSRT